MKSGGLAILFGLLLLGHESLRAESKRRVMMHSYQQDGIVIHIAFVDRPSGPICHINDGRVGSQPKVPDFEFPKLEFERIWAALHSEDIKRFERKKESPYKIEALNSYVFTIGEMPDGESTFFIVPKDHAPKTVIELAREIRAYNRN